MPVVKETVATLLAVCVESKTKLPFSPALTLETLPEPSEVQRVFPPLSLTVFTRRSLPGRVIVSPVVPRVISWVGFLGSIVSVYTRLTYATPYIWITPPSILPVVYLKLIALIAVVLFT